MSISFQCACGKRFKAKDDQTGKNFRCPKCGASIIVPEAAVEHFDTPAPTMPVPTSHEGTIEDFLAVNSGQAGQPSPPAFIPASKRRKRSIVFWFLILFFGGGALGVAACGGVVWYVMSLKPKDVEAIVNKLSAVEGETEIGRFNPKNVNETGHWAGDILEPLNSISIKNQIARENAAKTEQEKINVSLKKFVGQKVSWEMPCSVSKSDVDIPPHEGWVFLSSGFNRRGGSTSSSYDMAMMVLDIRDKKPKKTEYSTDNPDYDAGSRFFSYDIPSEFSRADAANLTDRVIVNGNIKEFEIVPGGGRFVLLVYLTDVTLTSLVKQ